LYAILSVFTDAPEKPSLSAHVVQDCLQDPTGPNETAAACAPTREKGAHEDDPPVYTEVCHELAVVIKEGPVACEAGYDKEHEVDDKGEEERGVGAKGDGPKGKKMVYIS
jgi:hypothetical protein